MTTKTQTLVRPAARPWATLLQRAWLAALIAAALAFALINLPYAPRTWFDEGSHLHVPKTLLQYGVYADISSEGFRYYGPTVGVGPTVLLPIALAFKLFGIGLIQGRLVIVAYFLAALAGCWLLARRMFTERVALLAVTLLLASRTVGVPGAVEYGRQVLGEIPGIAFLMFGALAWVAGVQRPHGWKLPLLAGLGFGLALVTKNQFALIVPPALAAVALLDGRFYRAGSWRLRPVPLFVACGCYGLWLLAQWQFLGPGSFLENLQQTRQAAGGAIFVFDIHATQRALAYLVRPDLYGGLLLPALFYTGWQARRRSAHGAADALLAALVGLWLLWYVVASLGWQRYAFPAVAFGAVLIARMLADLIGWLRGAGRPRLAWVLALYAALAVGAPLALSAQAIAHPDTSAQRFAAYLDATLPADTLIETWEPELGLLTNHRYHYPPIELLDTAVRHEWLGGPALHYDGLHDAPSYVVVGSFGAYTGVYPSDTLKHNYVEQKRIGAYTLYRHR
jgi:4-amino-4-deoxy-L-arabinose transferase-like glycosyltransferase